MSGEEVHEGDELVNKWIQEDHSLATHVVPLQEAKDKGQTALWSVPAASSASSYVFVCLQCTSDCMLLTDSLAQQESSFEARKLHFRSVEETTPIKGLRCAFQKACSQAAGATKVQTLIRSCYHSSLVFFL